MKLNQGFDGLLYGEMFWVFYETNKQNTHNRSDSQIISPGFECGSTCPDNCVETKAVVQSGLTKVVSWTSVEMFTSRNKRLMT